MMGIIRAIQIITIPKSAATGTEWKESRATPEIASYRYNDHFLVSYSVIATGTESKEGISRHP